MSSNSNISQTELIINVTIWVCALLYSIYCFTVSSTTLFRSYHDEYSNFVQGWSFLSRKQDAADEEWRLFKFLITKLSIWLIVSTTVSEILRKFKLIQVLLIWQICISIGFFIRELSIYATVLIILQPLYLLAVVLLTRSKLCIWVVNMIAIPLTSSYIMNSKNSLHLNNLTAYYTLVTTAWMNLRCMSYCLDLTDERNKGPNVLKYLSYCVYLPNATSGPFISYKDSKGCYYYSGDTFKRLRILLIGILRFSFWMLFTEFCLHFIYVAATSYHRQWIKSFDSWSLYGYGYTMAQFFHLKYLILYGLTTSFAKFENIKVPPLPICFGRIHLHSDMWKHFDVGLYNFIFRHIYIPSQKYGFVKNRIFATLLCFSFVYVWHGAQYYVLIWTSLNFLLIIIESFCKFINQKYIENSKFHKKIGPIWFRRMGCLAASPLLALSAISNFNFFAGGHLGDIFLFRLLNKEVLLYVSVILYSCCQVSTEIKLRSQKTKTEPPTLKND